MNGYIDSRVGVAGEFSRAIDTLYAEYDRDGSPGVNIAVIKSGRVIHQRGYGVANVEDDMPFTANTVLRLGSTTKHLCATCILILESRGLLTLQDDVHKHIPELPDFGETLRLSHLLTMTSGLRDGLSMLLFAGLGAQSDVSREQITTLACRDTTLMFRPGDDCTYSNTNYTLLSTIIERLSGVSLGEFMAQELFAPLGMNDTKLVPRLTQTIAHAARGYVPNAATGFDEGLMLVELSGDGGVVSTLHDMALWFANYRNDHVFGANYRQRLEASFPLNDGRTIDYRLGINVSTYRDEIKVSHAGGMPGFLCDFVFLPHADLGIVLLSNVFHPTLLDTPDRIADIVLHGGKKTKLRGDKLHDAPVGFFASATDLVQLERRDDGLVCFYLGEMHPLRKIRHGVLTSAKRGALIQILWREDAPDTIEINLGCMPAIALHRVTIPSPPRDLHVFSGTYFNSVMREYHIVTAREDHLDVVLDSPLRALVWKKLLPVDGDLFTTEIAGEPSLTNVQVAFRRDRSGTIAGFTYNLSRCKAVHFQRVSSIEGSRP